MSRSSLTAPPLRPLLLPQVSLKKAVSQQPVSVAIEADQRAFQLYMGGVFDDKECGKELDHGVLVGSVCVCVCVCVCVERECVCACVCVCVLRWAGVLHLAFGWLGRSAPGAAPLSSALPNPRPRPPQTLNPKP